MIICLLGLSTVGHTGSQAWGDETSILAGANLSGEVLSVNQESHVIHAWECQNC